MTKDSKIVLHTDNMMPVMGLGTWMLTDDTAETVAYALELGYRMIDTSSDYGTQPEIGKAIRNSSISRDELFIVTKIEETDDAYEAAKAYVKEMGLSYADLILIHRPPNAGAGEELWEGLIRAQKEGITRDIGVSNYSIVLMDTLIENTGVVPVVNQIEWNPFGYSHEMMAYCGENDIIIQAYSPLTRGTRLNDEKILEIADKYGKSPAQILIRWNLQQETVPIVKANKKHHLEENINVFDFTIDDADIAYLNSLNERYSALGSLPYV